jgi:hypothetical protein
MYILCCMPRARLLGDFGLRPGVLKLCWYFATVMAMTGACTTFRLPEHRSLSPKELDNIHCRHAVHGHIAQSRLG